MNSWAMLHDELYPRSDYPYDVDGDSNDDYIASLGDDTIIAGGPVHIFGGMSEDTISLDTAKPVVVTESKGGKDETFWKYSEGKILREVEGYLSSTYNSHYVGGESKIQTLDLIDSIGDAEAFCRSNAIKYLSRFGKKDGKNKNDILKVIHYAILLYHFTDLPFTEDSKETHSPLGY